MIKFWMAFSFFFVGVNFILYIAVAYIFCNLSWMPHISSWGNSARGCFLLLEAVILFYSVIYANLPWNKA